MPLLAYGRRDLFEIWILSHLSMSGVMVVGDGWGCGVHYDDVVRRRNHRRISNMILYYVPNVPYVVYISLYLLCMYVGTTEIDMLSFWYVFFFLYTLYI
ncbi:hypothetical protein F4810DRAFT_668817 [Camillea tinctor]|nr:hypothetical protein F4810DRAFT_668817 [Camillea tinctor]